MPSGARAMSEYALSGRTLDAIVRVSRKGDREGDSFYSPDKQEATIRRAAEFHGFALGNIYREVNQTGANVPRPALEEALSRATTGITDGIVVARFDRFTRSLAVMADAVDRILDAHATLYAVEDSIDIQTDTGQMLAKMLIMVAEWERKRRKADFADACERAVMDLKIHLGARPNTGYVRGEDRRLEPHPVFGSLIGEAFRRAAAGESWISLARYLMDNAVPTAWGNYNWTGRSVKEMLRNEVYLGVAYKGEFRNPDAHAPLTDPGTFARAQRRKTSPGSVSTGSSGLLAGLVRCAGCRYVMRADPPPKEGRVRRRFSCVRTHSAGTCTDPASCQHAELERMVVDRFFETVGELRASASLSDKTREAAELALAQRQSLLAQWASPDVQLAVTPGLWTSGLTERQAAVREAEQTLRELPTIPSLEERELQEEWPQMTIEQQRLLLHSVFDAIFVAKASRPGRHAEPLPERVHFCLSGSAPADMPRRGRKKGLVVKRFEPSAEIGGAAA
jgi:site-specific DNA recombinase